MSRARIEIKLGGQKRLLKFNAMAMYRYDQEQGRDGSAMELLETSPLTATVKLTLHALGYPKNENNLPEDLDLDLVAEWVDELPEKDYDRLVLAMMEGVKKLAGAMKRTGLLREMANMVEQKMKVENGKTSEVSVGKN